MTKNDKDNDKDNDTENYKDIDKNNDNDVHWIELNSYVEEHSVTASRILARLAVTEPVSSL